MSATTPAVALVLPSRWRAFVQLGKPRLSSLVLFTGGFGLFVAPFPTELSVALGMLCFTTLLVAAANALNCVWEIERDAQMKRTQNRPLPSGVLSRNEALVFALSLTAISLLGLYFTTNILTVLLGLIAWASYIFVYTPLKVRSTAALFVGAIPGAMPPLMGYTAVMNALEPAGLVLFWILFFWQLPHFLAIAIYLEQDYSRSGMLVFSRVHGPKITLGAMVVTSLLTVLCTIMPYSLGLVSWPYLLVAGGLALYQASLFIQPIKSKCVGLNAWARKFFLFTLAYLPILFLAWFLFS